MTERFTTYAQNFEDLMLYRALKGVRQGFYIDLGAAEPEMHSVTKAFYDRGWSGINVEPGQSAHARLAAARTRDVNLNIGVWNEKGPLTMYFIDDGSELSTTNNWLMEHHLRAGRTVKEEVIQVTTLTDICSEYVRPDQPIHFLKVDVEGAEPQVFRGHDFTRWRPWIVTVESHEPERKMTHWHEADGLVVNAGYRFTYCDGLNRFYVSEEKYAELKGAFEVPPNIYDNWVRAEELALEHRLHHAESTLAQLKTA
jgi:FkbM family methyltransferase